MIHVSLCLSGRELSEPTPSPDGEWVLFGTRSGGRGGLSIVPSSGGPERVLAVDPGPALGRGLGGGCLDWLPGSEGFVYAATTGQVWAHFLDGTRRCLTGLAEGHEVSSLRVSPDGRRVAYVVDLAEVRLVAVDDPSDDVVVGPSSDFVMDPSWSADGSVLVWQAWNVPDMPWDGAFVARWTDDANSTAAGSTPIGHSEPQMQMQMQMQMQQPRFGADGAMWDVCDASGWLNVRRDGVEVLREDREHAGPSWGPGQRSYAVSPEGDAVVLNRNEQGFGRLVHVDLRTGAATEVAKGVHGQLQWVGSRLTALRTGGRTPTQIVAYDLSRPRGPWERSTLAVGPVAEWSALEHHLVEPELIEVNTYQGARVPARAYRPADAADRVSGRLICWVHGGPTDQWQVTFMPRVSYWVSRGWTVLVPDHRGSTGHGRAFQQAMNHRWGIADVSDVAGCIASAHARGWGKPERTVLMGGSAGGYTALNVLAAHPHLVAGSAVVYPVTDPSALAGATHRFEAHYTDVLVGEVPVVVDPARLERPVLILHGDADPVVPVSHSVDFARRADESGSEVELHVYPGEGHGFRQPANQADEFARIEAFVDRIVGRMG